MRWPKSFNDEIEKKNLCGILLIIYKIILCLYYYNKLIKRF